MEIISSDKKSKEMLKYEEETGKFAIWRGIVTEGFKKWQKGEKIYEQDKERITILITEAKKKKWQDYIKNSKHSSISKLIREAVDFYIDIGLQTPSIKTISRIKHDLKEPLTLIKGFSQIILDNYKDDLSLDILVKIKDILDQSSNLENRIQLITNEYRSDKSQYDILIVDDDNSTIKVLVNFFELKGYSCKVLSSGSEVISDVQRFNPKIILLDILLPDVAGYDICNLIRENDKFKNNRIFFITAISAEEIEKKMIDSQADGYFLKPFDFTEFNVLFEFL